MKRFSIHPSFRIAFFVFGAFCIVLAMVGLGRWVRYKRAHGVVQVEYCEYKDHGSIKVDTNHIRMFRGKPVLAVGFMRSSGSASGLNNVTDAALFPTNAKPGDHVTILYREYPNIYDQDAAVIYSFNLIWRRPLSAALMGAFFIFVSSWFRSRPGYLFRRMHEDPV